MLPVLLLFELLHPGVCLKGSCSGSMGSALKTAQGQALGVKTLTWL